MTEIDLIDDPTTTAPGGPRMKGDARREQILATAVNLFSRNGFRGTTTKEIAQAAGVSEAMVFRHFANKEALYAAILDDKGCREGVARFPWEKNELLQNAVAAKDAGFAVAGREGIARRVSPSASGSSVSIVATRAPLKPIPARIGSANAIVFCRPAISWRGLARTSIRTAVAP